MSKRAKFLLLAVALLISATSIIVTQKFVKIFAAEEHAKIEIWAEATKRLLNEEYSEFTFTIIENNENIPVIIVDSEDNYITSRNFKEPKGNAETYYKEEVERLKVKNPPIKIELGEDQYQNIYYDDSLVLKQLAWFPYILMTVIALFVVLTIWVIFSTKESEQNKIWVGLTKETAHQLGTPLSSLSAWLEILKSKYPDDELLPEIDKDVEKIRIVTERFSKVGSLSEVKDENVVELVEESLDYMQRRSSKSINYDLQYEERDLCAVVSRTLFQWVIENVCKNSLDAMDKAGSIRIEIGVQKRKIYIDCIDTGKGIDKGRYEDIFKPGYTTKVRGWGLGLSLARRIVENYHKGKIFVKHSEVGKGSTIRIMLPLVENNL